MKNNDAYHKKISKGLFLVFLMLLAFTQADAQVTFRPGIRAGVNMSHFTQGDYSYTNEYYFDVNGNYIPYVNDSEFTNKTGFYVGFYGALRLTKYYTLQPEVTYSNQGSTYRAPVPMASPQFGYYNNNNYYPRKLDVSYLSVALVNKFTFNDKFNVHLGPTIDFVVDRNYPVYNDVDLAFTLGAGYNFNSNFGIEARVKKGIVPAINDNSGGDHTNVVFSFGATYTFNVK